MAFSCFSMIPVILFLADLLVAVIRCANCLYFSQFRARYIKCSFGFKSTFQLLFLPTFPSYVHLFNCPSV